MKVLNLINWDKSEVKYSMSIFPDGEYHIELDPIDRKETYRVVTRITNANELFVLMQVGNILNRQGVEFDLMITYLMTQRMDRVISFNEAFSLEIVANMINTVNATKVMIVEAHSDRAFKLIKNSEPAPLLVFDGVIDRLEEKLHTDIVICYPDHGAFSRYGKNKDDVIVLNKKRDLENMGKIVSLEFEKTPCMTTNPEAIIIRDDLCDAGGTFCWAADIIRQKYPNAKLYISVIHLVNPIGLKNLCEKFDGVFITNSYKDWADTPEAKKYENLYVQELR